VEQLRLVMGELQVADVPVIVALNKIDRLADADGVRRRAADEGRGDHAPARAP
jgi:50S ribosomal subunit-associated GTPase HflX